MHRLVARFPSLRAQEGFRPGIVHRLDKDTSGLICVALTEEARLRLAEAFAERRIRKEYLALVRGVPPATGLVDAPLGRHPTVKVKVAVVKNGKEARSEWRVLHKGRQYALLRRAHPYRTYPSNPCAYGPYRASAVGGCALRAGRPAVLFGWGTMP
ncbi:MAG: RNA pseudouridine synthase [Bilophila sp.]